MVSSCRRSAPRAVRAARYGDLLPGAIGALAATQQLSHEHPPPTLRCRNERSLQRGRNRAKGSAKAQGRHSAALDIYRK
jgi:hypothetical protein